MNFKVRRWTHAAVVPLAVLIAACADELGSNPQVEECNLSLPFTINPGPATIRYLVSANGVSVVETVSFTTPSGVETLTSPVDEEADDLYLIRDVTFNSPASGSLTVTGEIGSPGGIGIAYSIFPADTLAAPENAAPIFCSI